MSKELDNKVALITGGTTGIGRDTAILFAREGAKVVFSGRREVEGNETLNLVRAEGGDGLFVKSDASKSADVESLVQKTVERFGRLDVSFNNAGVEGEWLPLVEQTEENWDQVHNINLKGVWLSMKYEIRQMLKQGGGGAVVNMSSVAGLIGAAGAGVYVSSKHGVLGLTKVIALEAAEHNITANAICPAYVRTPLVDKQIAEQARRHGISHEDVVRKIMTEPAAIHRLLDPDEVASLALYLCSDAASGITGAAIDIDLGWTAR